MTSGTSGRGDLLRVARVGGSELQQFVAEAYGFTLEDRALNWPDQKTESSRRSPESQFDFDAKDLSPGSEIDETSDHVASGYRPSRLSFWTSTDCVSVVPLTEAGNSAEDRSDSADANAVEVGELQRVETEIGLKSQADWFRPLSPPNRIVTELRRKLAAERPRNSVDINRMIREFVRGRFLNRIPRKHARAWGNQLVVIEDYSIRLQPYLRDFSVVRKAVRKIFPEFAITTCRVSDTESAPVVKPFVVSPVHAFGKPLNLGECSSVLVLGDLGVLSSDSSVTSAWHIFMQKLEAQAANVSVLFPAHASRMPTGFSGLAEIIEWSRSTSVPANLELSLRQLLALVSLTILLEPSLLRELRRLVIDGQCDAGLEGLVWSHPILLKRHIYGATPNPLVAAEFTNTLESMDPATVKAARHLIYQFHQDLPEEIRLEEILRAGGNIADPDRRLRELAENWLIGEVATLPQGWDREREFQADRDWALRLVARFPASRIETSAVGDTIRTLYRRASRDRPDMKPPGYMKPDDFETEDPETLVSICRGKEHFEFNSTLPKTQTRFVTGIRAKWRQLKIETAPELTHDGNPFWESGEAPDWASGWGRDEFGAWVEFQIAATEKSDAAEAVTVRLRWVPAGTFLMGSPDDEEGRFSDEGPQHEVRISNGFWMFDAPVTQALWKAVLGEAPSKFKGADRPVESVSWNDCQQFIERLNERVPGLNLGLPTEAEWEHACRGGTSTPRYVEDAQCESLGWVWENSEENDQPETHPVKQKIPNPHGLYDTLGNVWEWCQDNWRRTYASDAETDPLYEPDDAGSANRVIRGGSWDADAQRVRAASRYGDPPDTRDDDIGFRCRVQPGELRPAEQGGEGGARLSGGAVTERSGTAAQSDQAEPGGTSEIMSDPRARLLSGKIFLGRVKEIGLDNLPKPEWAQHWGTDEFGVWADLFYGVGTNHQIQRLRLIPPGTFLMGSPDDEEGRFDREGSQHEVTISTAFWMFDSPCTQLIYRTVCNSSPSRFAGDNRPVERVSWHDAKGFIIRTKILNPAAELGLPSEAEWEYACRAGTTAPNYEASSDLDRVAWYGSKTNGTRPVRQKKANNWGLYDTLGNVREWCQDEWLREYTTDSVVDPLNERAEGAASAYRVIRGGSWDCDAQLVRAAYRYGYPPDTRYDYIGFRCRVQAGELQQAVERHGEGGAMSSGGAAAEPGGTSETSSDTRAEGSAKNSTWVNLLDRDSDSIPIPQSPAIRVISDIEEITLRKITRPSWATAMGRDRFGLWCEFEIPRHVTKGSAETLQRSRTLRRRHGLVVQRLRWVPPGSYQFGSPKGEAGRYDHEFELTTDLMEEGYWVFDTPVTQELWEAVMGENPSHFVSPTRPVEFVSWDDCQLFLERIAAADIGKNLPRFNLLTEREWECACRAGTTEATYSGPVEYIGDGNAPALDDIAVYAGNCGIEWDLEDGSELGWIGNKQYDFEKGGTRPVQLKRPNSLGLYDMLGNVFEWCNDLWHLPNGPVGEDEADRVIRGGSWLNNAQDVRAARRRGVSPDFPSISIGFRCRVR